MAIGEDENGNYYGSYSARILSRAKTNYAFLEGTEACFGKSECHSPINSPANRAGEGDCKNYCNFRRGCENYIRDNKKKKK